jgi:peptidoglycan DL-endopeptidase CwlO
MVTDKRSRRWWLIAVLPAMMAVFFANPAAAAPDEDAGTPEGLKAALEAANRGYVDARNALDASRARQAEITKKIAETQQKVDDLSEATRGLLVMAYRNNGLASAAVLLASGSPDQFFDRATAASELAHQNNKKIKAYNQVNRDLADQKKSLDAEIAVQEQQLALMEKRKKDAEKAVGGAGEASAGYGKTVPPGPGGRSGGCNIKDPSGTGGCVTNVLLYAYNQTKAAGFNHYVSCYRSAEDGGEHPRGRACDWAADEKGFGGVATGSDKTYGDNLANFYIANSKSLNVLYVIWFRRIWQTATGSWKSYGGQCGSPSCDHTNHLHLSVN